VDYADAWIDPKARTLMDSGLATQATQTAIWHATTCLRATGRVLCAWRKQRPL
jgi:hypothetical protein